MVRLGEANPAIWDEITSEMVTALKEFEFTPEDIEIDWKRLADSQKLEREVFAKYGYFKDIILHPTFQLMKQWLSENISLDLFLGEALMPVATGVIILYMLNKRVTYYVMFLIGSFIFNVNPLYVALSTIVYWWFAGSRLPKQFIKRRNNSRSAKAKSVTPGTIEIFSDRVDKEKISYDHVVIGSDISALYTAAILSRNGHSCLVLQPTGAPATEIFPNGAPCSVPISNLVVGKVERYKALLDLVQAGNMKDKIQFSKLGSERDGFTHTIMQICHGHVEGLSQRQKLTGVTSFRATEGGNVDGIASLGGGDKQAIKQFTDAITAAQEGITSYLVTKVLPFGQDAQFETIAKSVDAEKFINIARSTTSQLLDQSIDDPVIHAALNGMAVIGADEALQPTISSAAGLAQFLALSEKGLYYPNGGILALKKALVSTIQASGGAVYSNVPVKEICIEDGTATGVVVDETCDSEVKQNEEDSSPELVFDALKTVVSCTGILNTFTRLVTPRAVSDAMRAKLSGLAEARPKIQVIHWVRGTTEDLGLANIQLVGVSADYQSIVRLTGNISQSLIEAKKGSYTSSYFKLSIPSLHDCEWSSRNPGVHCIVFEVELPDAIVTLNQFRFKEPASVTSAPTESNLVGVDGPSLYEPSSGNTTLKKAGASSIGSQLQLSKSVTDKLKAWAIEKISEAFPLAIPHIMHVAVSEATVGGFQLSSNVSKYMSKLGACTDIPGLFLGGKDTTSTGLMGEIQAGLIAANAVLGYTANEIILGSGLFHDLQNLNLK